MGAIVAGGLTGLLNQSSAQMVDGSLKFDSGLSNYLNRTPSSSGNRKTWTWSGWVKRNKLGATQFVFEAGSADTATDRFLVRFQSDDTLLVTVAQANNRLTSQVFRDVSSWGHLVIAVDTTQSTANDRSKIYWNGSQITDFSTITNPNQDAITAVNSAAAHSIGKTHIDNSNYLDGYQSNIYLIDGQALGPENFGFTDPLTGTWRPKKFSGSFTTTSVLDGTIWTSKHSGTVYGGSVANVFDSDLTDRAEINNSDSNDNHFTVSSISVKASKIGVYVSHSGSDVEVSINGSVVGTIASGSITTSSQLFSFTFTETTITSIKVRRVGSTSGWYLYGINVDDVRLLDGANFTGVNSFYLPMDGNSPIGEDKSGKGNNWTPVSFGGSVSLDNPIVSGALPILNTDGGGNVARVGVRTDAYHANLVLALPLVGSANDVSNSVNSGSTTKAISVNGSSATSASSNFYGGSWDLERGSSQYLSWSSTETAPDTGDFTYEVWFNTESNNNYMSLFDARDAAADSKGFFWGIDSNGQYYIFYGTDIRITAGNVISTGRWYHGAVTRQSGILKMWLDGVLIGTYDTSNSNMSTDVTRLGSDVHGANYYFDGKLQDARIYIGVAKYTSNFVVPATSPDILPDTPSGVSGSSKLTKITDGAVAFDGTGDYLNAGTSSDYAFGTGDFTIEAFVYHTYSAQQQTYFADVFGNSAGVYFAKREASNNNVLLIYYSDVIVTGATPLTENRWYHVAVSRSGSTIRVFLNGVLDGSASDSTNLTSTEYYIGESPSSSSGEMFGFISNFRVVKGTALYTSSFTPPTRTLTNVTNTKLLCCQSTTNVRLSPVAPNVGITTTTRFNSNFESIPTTVNGLTVTNNGSVTTTSAGTNSYGFTNCADLSGSNSLSVDLGTIPALTTIDIIFKVTGTSDNKYVFGIGGNGLVRRSSSSFDWYNGSDTDLTTSEIADGNWHHLRVTPTRLYFDNTLIENNTSYQFINNNGSSDGDNSGHMALGAFRNGSGTIQYNGAIDIGLVRVMPGVDLGAPSSYPITTNGTLSDTETIPNDGIIVARGNSAATTFNPFNTDINTVRGQETGYCTLNPINNNGGTLSNGNLSLTSSGAANISATLQIPTTGKWYWEYFLDGTTSGGVIGIADGSAMNGTALGDWTKIYGYSPNGNKYENASASSYGATLATGDLVSVKYDADTRQLEFLKNNISQGVAYTVSGQYDYYPSIHGNIIEVTANFGQKPFKFPPPAGFQPLNAANVRPETVITRPDHYVGTILYVGAGATKTFTGLNFGDVPDLVWMKNRDRTSYGDGTSAHHYLYDTVRGTGTGKMLTSSTTEQEGSKSTEADLDGFVRDGFRLDAASGTDCINNSGDDFVAWCWKAGGNKNTFNVDDVGYASAAAAGLTGGTITPTGSSVGTRQGFSIIGFTDGGSACSIPHGLTKAPDFYIVKFRGASGNWSIYHKSLGNTKRLKFTTDNSGSADAGWWQNTSPTSSLFYLGGNLITSTTQIAYLWHDVPGLQKFGSYTGGGSSYPFIELGFSPAILMIKNASTGGTHYDWKIIDSTRNPFNLGADNADSKNVLFPNLSDAENKGGSAWAQCDFLSNGFRMNDQSVSVNNSGSTYVYAAWAEAPVSNLYGGQSNAR